MRQTTPVSIAVLTFRRPEGLSKALDSLITIAHRADSTLDVREIIVIDNDPSGSAERAVSERGESLIRYVHEPGSGVAAARNRALDEAAGDRLVFIDDDEHAGPNWPDGLIDVMDQTGAALVGGPMRSILPAETPDWAMAVGVFDRVDPAHLSVENWLRSGNLAIELGPVRDHELRFDDAFGLTGGEDVRFSVLAKRCGLDLRWCATAIVYEDVAIERITATWVEHRSQAAMTNYIRAHAPIGPSFALRMLIRAVGRIPTGLASVAAGQLARDEARTLRGKVALARARGAFIGVARAVAEARDRRRTSSASRDPNGR